VSNLRQDDIMPGATGYDGEKYFICLCRAEKKTRAQMKFNSQGGAGGGVKEDGMESSLYTLDPCLMLLLTSLMGKGNVNKPSLVVYERSVQEGVHRLSFIVMLFAKWEALESKYELSVKILRDLELGSMGKTINCPIMDHVVMEDPKAWGIARR